jgi:hypothetical protein
MAELPTLAQGTMPSFTPPAEDRDSASSLLRGALGDQFSGIGNLMDRKAKADEEAMRLEQEQKKSELERKAKDYGTYVEGIKTKYKQAEPALMAAPPKFNVTKDTEEGLTGLAALMTVGSLIVGSKGATSGVNAMNAMTGVLKGYQEGNQQRIDFETKKYEQSIKEWERTLAQTKESLSRYEKLAATDLSAATAQAAADAASKGQEVIAAKIRQEGISQTKAMVDKLIQQTATSKTQWATINGQTGLYSPAEVRAAQEAGATVAQAKGGRAAGLGGYAQQFEDLTAIATNEAALAAQALVKAPFANTGLFQGRNTSGLLDAPIGVLANTLTSESVQQYNVIMGNMGTNITKVLYGGRVVPVKVQEAFNNRFAIKQGDNAFTVLLKMADMRQTFERAIEVKLANQNLSPEIKEIYKKTEKEFIDAVPFTMNDVLDAQAIEKTAKGKKAPKTFGDFMGEKMGGGSKPQTGVAPKKSAEQRYGELEGSGMSEADIFKQMQGEGY